MDMPAQLRNDVLEVWLHKSRDAPTAGHLCFSFMKYGIIAKHSLLTFHGIVQSRCPEFLVYGHQGDDDASTKFSVKTENISTWIGISQSRIGYRLYYTPDIFRFQ